MRRLSAVLVLVTAGVLGTASPVHAEPAAATLPHGRVMSLAEVQAEVAAAPAETHWYRIMNWNSKLYLTVAAPADVNGSPIVQRGYLGGSQSQAWTLTAGTVEHYSYLRSAATSSWKALGISGSSAANGGKAINWTYTPGLADQQWRQGLPLPGLLVYPLKNLNSSKCLGIPGSSKDAGVQAIQWDCRTGLGDQYWVFTSWE
ncbi:RICIN domain-containing protein [Dactylosporangium sp. McL0621]|uniref:RICIN domain-containing protein n=1 Tax=Dactylosporangium sp. McL0621 TaxID=3415678 RepID=UPI003CEB42AB